MVLYSKFAYGSQFSGGKNNLKIWYLVAEILSKNWVFFLGHPVFHLIQTSNMLKMLVLKHNIPPILCIKRPRCVLCIVKKVVWVKVWDGGLSKYCIIFLYCLFSIYLRSKRTKNSHTNQAFEKCSWFLEKLYVFWAELTLGCSQILQY